ncbi:MAG: DUF4249 domain-containing protein [Bacteroidia bacterium]
MMKNIKLILILLIATACERVVTNVPIPKTEPQLVIFSFLSPEVSIIEVGVSITNPIFNPQSNQSLIVSNADVSIVDENGNSKNIPFDNTTNTYRLDQSLFKIEPGFTYEIIAVYKNYTAKGKTNIPLSKAVIQKNEYIPSGSRTDNQPTARIKTTWSDIPIEANYYRVVNTGKESFFPDLTDLCNDKLLNDKNNDGQQMHSYCDNYYSDYSDNEPYFEKIQTYLLTTDVHYYQYHIRRLNYIGDDPFSEPFQMYTNVKGGLGCVGSYRMDSNTIKLK